MSETLFHTLGSELSLFFRPVLDALGDAELRKYLLDALGSSPDDPAGAKLVSTLQPVIDVVAQIESLLNNPSAGFSDITSLLSSAKAAFDAIQPLDAGSAADLGPLGEDLLDLLTGIYLAQRTPVTYRVLVLLTVIDAPAEIAASPAIVLNGKTVRKPVELPRFHPDRLLALIENPVGHLKSYYLNALQTDQDAAAVADKLFPRIAAILTYLRIANKYGLRPEEAALLGDAVPYQQHAFTVYVTEQLAGDDFDSGFNFAISPAQRGDLGLVISPFGSIDYTYTSGNLTFDLDFTAAVDAAAIGRRGVVIAAGMGTTSIDGKLGVKLAPPAGSSATAAFVLGSSNGTRLELAGATFDMEVSFTAGAFDFGVSAAVTSAKFVLAPSDGDGFLSSVLPSDGLTSTFDLGLGWSNKAGLSFHGAASLEATLPIGINIGDVVRLPALYLALRAANGQLATEVSTQISLSIGPIAATIDRVGLAAAATFPRGGGNLGIADLDLSFKPPSGVGLAIDTGGLSGGGFLSFLPATHEYSGVLQLQFEDLTLQAFGIITTQVAGGHGYSLLALIDADFPPVQLGLGFALSGVGGLLAIHRTASVDALRAGLRADALSKVLFPTNAITNAPQILAELETLFPTAPGRFLFGPMALITWGTPPLLKAAVAVILELPQPIRILLLARMAVRAPSESNALVRINMDALGVLDFGQSTLALDATLFDSHLLSFTLSGDMALRVGWGEKSEFLLAIGGFHPRFTAPAGFPALERITINMPSGIISKLRLAAYLAITSNSVQFGATLDVVIGTSGFGLSGDLGFDALLQVHPFHFEVDISGKVAIRFAGEDLASVSLTATLSGPAPWHIAGSFKIHIIFFDVHKSFSHSWGEDAPDETVPAVNVLQLLTAVLADPRSWDAQLPDGAGALTGVRRIEAPAAVVAHPLALPGVRERLAPLGIDISRFGDATPAGGSRFAITGWQINGQKVPQHALQEEFAPAQFLDLSEEEKLAGPSYELHDAGLSMDSGLAKTGSATVKAIEYETSYIDEPGGEPRKEKAPGRPVADFAGIVGLGSAGLAQAREQHYAGRGNPVRVSALSFVVVGADNLAWAGIGAAGGQAYGQARELLRRELTRAPQRRGTLQIVAIHERAA